MSLSLSRVREASFVVLDGGLSRKKATIKKESTRSMHIFECKVKFVLIFLSVLDIIDEKRLKNEINDTCMYGKYLKKLSDDQLLVAHQEWTSTKNLRAPSSRLQVHGALQLSLWLRRLLFMSSAMHRRPHFFFSESCSHSEDILFLSWVQHTAPL